MLAAGISSLPSSDLKPRVGLAEAGRDGPPWFLVVMECDIGIGMRAWSWGCEWPLLATFCPDLGLHMCGGAEGLLATMWWPSALTWGYICVEVRKGCLQRCDDLEKDVA